MTNAAVPLQILQIAGVEHFREQAAALAAHNVPVIGAGNTRAFLAAVLQGVQPKICEQSGFLLAVDAEHAAFFVNFVFQHDPVPFS